MPTLSADKLLAPLLQPSSRLLAGVQVVLVLALAYAAAQFTWQLLPPTPPLEAPTSSTPSERTQAAAPKAISRLPEMHLFGRAQQQAIETPQQVDLPETQLRLTLRGLIASTEPSEARAIVADPSGKENFYKIGDRLPGGAELTEIHPDRIVLKRGGRFETLRLPKELLSSDQFSQTEAPSARGNTPRGRPSQPQAATSSMNLKQYRDALLNDPRSVTDMLSIQPVSDNGSFQGYKLQAGRDPEFMTRHGLRPGDVVVGVNGQALDSPAKGLSALKELSTATSINLEIERNGVRMQIPLAIR